MFAFSYMTMECSFSHGSKNKFHKIVTAWKKFSITISMRTHILSYNRIEQSTIGNNTVEGLRLLKINSFYP